MRGDTDEVVDHFDAAIEHVAAAVTNAVALLDSGHNLGQVLLDGLTCENDGMQATIRGARALRDLDRRRAADCASDQVDAGDRVRDLGHARDHGAGTGIHGPIGAGVSAIGRRLARQGGRGCGHRAREQRHGRQCAGEQEQTGEGERATHRTPVKGRASKPIDNWRRGARGPTMDSSAPKSILTFADVN